MYYTILPSQAILDRLILDRYIHKDLHAALFVSTDESLANNVLTYLNSLPPSSFILQTMMYIKVPATFQLKSVEDTSDFPEIFRSIIIDNIDTNAYPYNYLFPEGLANINKTLTSSQKSVDRSFPEDATIVAQIRS